MTKSQQQQQPRSEEDISGPYEYTSGRGNVQYAEVIPQQAGADVAASHNFSTEKPVQDSNNTATEEKENKCCNGWIVGGIVGGVCCLLLLIVVGVVVAVFVTQDDDDPEPSPTVVAGNPSVQRPTPPPFNNNAPSPTAPDRTTPNPTPFPTESPITTTLYTLTIAFDSWANEISYALYDDVTGAPVFDVETFDSSFSNSVWDIEMTIIAEKRYELVIYDSVGDGLNDGGGSNPGYFAFYHGTSSSGTLLWISDFGEEFLEASLIFVA